MKTIFPIMYSVNEQAHIAHRQFYQGKMKIKLPLRRIRVNGLHV